MLPGEQGLPFSMRCTDELVIKAVSLGAQMPFQRSSDILKKLTAGLLSAYAIRQAIAAKAKTVVFRDDVPGKTVLTDSTKVKAGLKERGASVQMAITAKPGPMLPGGRQSRQPHRSNGRCGNSTVWLMPVSDGAKKASRTRSRSFSTTG